MPIGSSNVIGILSARDTFKVCAFNLKNYIMSLPFFIALEIAKVVMYYTFPNVFSKCIRDGSGKFFARGPFGFLALVYLCHFYTLDILDVTHSIGKETSSIRRGTYLFLEKATFPYRVNHILAFLSQLFFQEGLSSL